MKRTFIFMLSAAAMLLSSCQEKIDAVGNAEGVTVDFVAQSLDTKTSFGTPSGTTYPTLWTANDENVKVSLNGNTSPVNVAVNPSVDGTTASFSFTIKETEAAPYTFRVASPASAAKGYSATNGWNLEIPSSQTPIAGSVDESAQILVAKSAELPSTPTEPVALGFSHFTAYGKLTIENLAAGAGAVSSITLTAEDNFVGRYYYNDGVVTENSASKVLTIATSSLGNVWFACAPVNLTGKSLKITVAAAGGTYTKTINFPAGKGNFESGKIASFTVDFAGIMADAVVTYNLVKSLSELTDGSEVIIASVSGNMAISTIQNANNRGAASVTISSESISNPADNVQILTLAAGSTSNTISLGMGGTYLYAVSGENYLRTKNVLDATSSWNVEITAAGVATIKNKAANTYNLKYNTTSNVFSCYTTSQTDVSIYKREGSGNSTVLIRDACATPVIECVSNTVSITCGTAGATIYYTTDGTTPTASSATYSSPFAIAATTTVKAIAVKTGLVDSDVASKSCVYVDPTPLSTVSFVAGTDITSSNHTSTIVKSGISLQFAKGTSGADLAYYSPYRWYKYNTATISAGAGVKIKQIIITFASGYAKTMTPNTGSYSLDGLKGTWVCSSDVNSVLLTNNDAAARLTTITVKYSE